MSAVIDQFDVQTGLLHMPGLTYFGMVETNEFRGFGVVAEGESFRSGDRAAQPLDQRFELLLLSHLRHHASPPKTSTWEKTQAGEAWPTRTT